tara:strand:+ start:1015 stop:1443 length:429 start_codon:yes stop_codon:yes gene_type:complete
VKKKYVVPDQDKKDWADFTKQTDDVSTKEVDLIKTNNEEKKISKLDLHGRTLSEANDIVKKFINDAFENGNRKILIVTGKGSRSKSYDNPYVSEKMSVLKHSVPDFIVNDESLKNKISKISKADDKHGGEGAIYIFLKKNKL